MHVCVRGWGTDGKLLKGNTRSKGGFWLNQSDRILAEDWPYHQTNTGKRCAMRDLVRY